MMSWSKKILAYLLVFAMTLSLVPVTAQAEGADVYTMTGTLDTWEYLSVPLNASVTLTAAEEVLTDYKYQWFGKAYEDDKYTIITEATGVDYTIDEISTKMQYYCDVCDENGEWLGQSYFEISIDSGLKGYVAGTEDDCVDMQVSNGGSVTMEVDASVDVGNASYKWYQRVPEGDEETEGDILLDSTTESCTVSDINEYTEYYCEVSDDYGNWERVWFYVSVASGLYAYADVEEESNYKDVKVAQSETATLTVYAGVNDGMGNVSYEWYKDDELLEGKTESTCETDAITTRTTYSCKVSDAYGAYAWVNFYVSVNSGLKAYVADSKYEETEAYVEVPVGQATTLEVAASVTDESTISYAWYDENPSDYEEDDENYPDELGSESAYTVDEVCEKKTYYCKVSDAYGGSITICFYVSVASGLKAYVKDDPNQDTSANLEVKPTDEVTLEVFAKADEGELITCEWWKGEPGEGILIEEANSTSYTVTGVEERATYCCVVSDAYGNSRNVYFYLTLESGLSVYAVVDENVSVSLNEKVTLEVAATAAEGITLAYQWYRINVDSMEYEPIEGANAASYTTEAITKCEGYMCTVTDSYGNEESVWFTIGVENNFKLEAVGNTSVVVPAGGTTTLAVNATADSALTYQWSKGHAEGWADVVGATASTYTTGAITERTIFNCEVCDEYGNNGIITFIVNVDNGLTVQADGPTDLTVDKNGSVTLKVNATANNGEITYSWLKGEEWMPGDGATYTIENVTEYAEYTCEVTDMYGDVKYVKFYVRVNADSGLSVVADGNEVVEVELGARTTLKVKASTTTDVKLTYKWYEYESAISDWVLYTEGVANFETPQIKKESKFKCVVWDEYGKEKEVIFTVKLVAEKGEEEEPSGENPGGGDTPGAQEPSGDNPGGSEAPSTQEPSGDNPGGSETPSTQEPSGDNPGGSETPSSPDSGKETPSAGGDQQETAKQVTRLKLVGASKKIVAGKKLTLTPVFTPADATNQQLTWSTSNKKYATVSSKGVVTTKKAGAGKSVTITATTQDGSNVKATYKISIVKHAVKSIKITAKSKTVKAGKQLKLKATVKTTGKTANKTLAWTSSNTKYATVTSKGVVKTKKAGKGKKVKITAKATDGSGKKATVTIKIK